MQLKATQRHLNVDAITCISDLCKICSNYTQDYLQLPTELIRSLSLEITRKLGPLDFFWPLDFLFNQTPTNLEHYSLSTTEDEVDALCVPRDVDDAILRHKLLKLVL